ncbi:MAG: hypothetical protein GY951_13890 [Psychromonas sp.]|nr:hypothetical protein [Psychromonas sp.]
MLRINSNSPFISIASMVIIVLVIGAILLAILGADPLVVLLLFLGALIGPIFVLIEPVHSLIFKLFYVAALLSLIGLIAFGLKKGNLLWGKGIIFIAIVGWLYCGGLGLSA